MKNKLFTFVALVFLAALNSQFSTLQAQGTAFTYHGRLSDAGSPANGSYDLTFALFSAGSGPAQEGPTLTNAAVSVSNGLFTVMLDFGDQFPGTPRWLEIAVRTNGSMEFASLAPRQQLTATPYAVTANAVTGPINGSSIVSGSISSAQLAAGAVTAANIASKSITSSQLATGAAAANLNAFGQSGVASGGMILSSNSVDGNLVNAGYVKLGKVDLGDVWEQRASGTPPTSRGLQKAVWTGSEMIVWGGVNGSSYLIDGARYNPAANAWSPITTNGAPAGRIDNTAVWTGSELIIWGGHDGTSEVNTGGRYNPASDSWTTVTTTGAPVLRRYHTAVWTGTEMIIWGGYNGNVGVLNSGARYHPALNSWTAVTLTGAPFSRQQHSAVWTGNEMIIWGGYRGDSDVNTGGRYNPVNNSWITVSTTNSPSARSRHTAVWTGNEMIVWGGVSGSANLATGGRYSPLSDSWNALNTAGAPTPRLEHAAVWTGTEMIIWGGVSNNFGYVYLNDHGRYNPALNTWTSIATNGAPTGRYSHSAIWTGNEMIVWGGFYFDGTAHYLNDCGRYNPAANSWTAGAATTAPSRRSMHSAVWTGSEMIVWGGFYYDSFFGGSRFNNGGRYNPAANSWTAITTNGAPIERYKHAAFWTGTEMVVWGGETGNSGNLINMHTGGRYDPVANSWTAMSTVGAPTARHDFSAVWTGTQMIIWGGFSNTVTFASGGRYNPASNIWSAVTTSGAPSNRAGHMAVWTGTEMLIWGGSSNGVLVTGSRYNPSGDSWTAMTTTGAPSGRTGCSAIWTGVEMIVWGGAGPAESYTNNGARYHPGSNTWTALPSVGSFTPRVSHTAIWTGSEMIIWSGYNNNANPSTLNDGVRFNPKANTWSPITTEGAPAGRSGNSAVWTGSEMIIFGGADFSSYVGSTFSYRPPRALYLYQKP